MTFAQFNFDKNIFKAIENCGYKHPTPIQTQSIPEILNGNDLVASAQTGTGKTAAFVLPALQKLISSEKVFKPRVLILTPTRELALQINQAVEKYGKFMQLKVATLMGGMSYRQQLRKLSGALDVIVATPGRLMDHMENRRVDLSGIEMLVLDEADRMLDMGFIDDVNYIAKQTPQARQTLLFSATVDDRLNKVISQLLKSPTRIALSREKMAPTQITQEIYFTNNEQHKKQLLNHILENQNIFKGIIFTATKISADRLAGELNESYSVDALHGDLKQNRRNKIVENFRNGKIQLVVATDVAARGIDVQDVTHVINYDLPKFSEDYVHRIGRTGRAGKSGIAISFASRSCGRNLQKIERFIKQKLDVKTISGLEPSKSNFSQPNQENKSFKNKKKKFQHSSFSKNNERRFNNKDRFGSDSKHKEKRFGKKDRFESDHNNQERRFSKKDRFESNSNNQERRFGNKDRFGSDSKHKEKRFGKKDRFESDHNNQERRFGNKDRFGSDSKHKEKRFGKKDRFESDHNNHERRFSKKDRFESSSKNSDDKKYSFKDKKKSDFKKKEQQFKPKKRSNFHKNK